MKQLIEIDSIKLQDLFPLAFNNLNSQSVKMFDKKSSFHHTSRKPTFIGIRNSSLFIPFLCPSSIFILNFGTDLKLIKYVVIFQQIETVSKYTVGQWWTEYVGYSFLILWELQSKNYCTGIPRHIRLISVSKSNSTYLPIGCCH